MSTELTTQAQKHRFCNEALELKKDIEVDFLTLGAMLFRIEQNNLWEAGWSSWEEYTMELKMSPATVSKLIRIYKIFHVQYGIEKKELAEAGGWSVVAEYLPMVNEKTTPKQVRGWIGEASQLTRADVRRNIVEARKGTDMARCKHPNAYILEVCPDCGDRHRIEKPV